MYSIFDYLSSTAYTNAPTTSTTTTITTVPIISTTSAFSYYRNYKSVNYFFIPNCISNLRDVALGTNEQ